MNLSNIIYIQKYFSDPVYEWFHACFVQKFNDYANLDMCFLVEAIDVIICCTTASGPGSPSFFRIWIKITPLHPESRLKKRLCITFRNKQIEKQRISYQSG